MSRFKSILLPLDGSPEAARGSACALWLSESLGAMLHVLHAAQRPLPGAQALSLLHVPEASRAQVVLHQMGEPADAAVLQAIRDFDVDLVVLGARGESASAGRKKTQSLGSIARAVIERSPVPVLLFPRHYRPSLPWKSMLAAASGDRAADEALLSAIHLADALDLMVTVLHAEDEASQAYRTPLGAYADEPHHEYPCRVQGLVERALSSCSSAECSRVKKTLFQPGDVATVLLRQVAEEACGVMVLGWHGKLDAGRALVLKRLLEEANCPLLLVRKGERSTARLKVGEGMEW